jgi:hypothetical protein
MYVKPQKLVREISGGRILRAVVPDLLKQMTSDWSSGFRCMNEYVYISELLFVAISLTSPWTHWDLQIRYWFFLSLGKLTGIIR